MNTEASDSESALRRAKSRVSPALLQTPGVSGVGVHGGKLMVYLVTDSEDVREKVQAILLSNAPEVAYEYKVTGKFVKK